MKILLSPQISDIPEERIRYTFKGDIVTAELNGVKDTFDFTGMPEGFIPDVANAIDTELPVQPILSVKRENGELHLELLNYIGPNESGRLAFPSWMDAKDYTAPELPEPENKESEPSGEN